MTNIIGDVAGQYKALVALTQKMPEGEIISVGDMVDRGPDSCRVIEFFMKEGRRAILGNHEHMMLDHLQELHFYNDGVWLMQGGWKTLESYGPNGPSQEHIDWLRKLPKYIEIDDTLVAHSFLRPSQALQDGTSFGDWAGAKGEATIVWNRWKPVRRSEWTLQIAGHNSQFGLRKWNDEQGLFAICLDDSRTKVLTGLHLETMTIYQQPYLE